MIGNLRALLYHRTPVRVCYLLDRASIKSLDEVRRQVREQLIRMNGSPDRLPCTEHALAAIDTAEAAAAIVRDVYGCKAGRACRVVAESQRQAFEKAIALRLAELSQPRLRGGWGVTPSRASGSTAGEGAHCMYESGDSGGTSSTTIR